MLWQFVVGKTVDIGSETYSMKAEVALLTRNIRITSLEYDDRENDAFWARVLVSTFSSDKSVTGRVAACSQHCSYRGRVGGLGEWGRRRWRKIRHSMAYHTLWTHGPWKSNGHRFDTRHHSFLELSAKLPIIIFLCMLGRTACLNKVCAVFSLV